MGGSSVDVELGLAVIIQIQYIKDFGEDHAQKIQKSIHSDSIFNATWA